MFVCAASAADTGDRPAEELLKTVRKSLDVYYKTGQSPNLEQIIVLASGGGKYAEDLILAYLSISKADELSGKAPWRSSPFWGDEGQNAASKFRQGLLDELVAKKIKSRRILRWCLFSEHDCRRQGEALKSVIADKSTEASGLLVSLIELPHPNAFVLCAAYEEAARRGLAVGPKALVRDVRHYRPSLRNTARDYAKKRGVKLSMFDRKVLLNNPRLVKIVEKCLAICRDLPPVGRRFVKIKSLDKWRQMGVARGFLIAETPKQWTLFTPYYKVRRFDRGGKAEMVVLKMSDEVSRIVKLTKNDRIGLSEGGGLTGQFEHGPSYYEIIVALQLYRDKQYGLFLDLFCPALDVFYTDDGLPEYLESYIGMLCGRQMLVAFVGDRDYSRALKIAKRIVAEFPDVRFSGYARELLRQLPKRGDDFGKLSLPTPAEWSKLRQTMTRDDRIKFLCRRLRLLNCFQYGQPGGVSYADPQFREPRGISEDASWGGVGGKTIVINPYVRLTGKLGWTYASKTPEHLNLTVKDIGLVAAFLKERWFIPSISFWRSFHPSRTLHTTDNVICELINQAAGEELVSQDQCDQARGAKRIGPLIARLVAHAEKFKDVPARTLILQRLDRELEGDNVYWRDVRRDAHFLAGCKDPKLLGAIERCLKKTQDTDAMDLCLKLSSDKVAALKKYRTLCSDPGYQLHISRKLTECGADDEAFSILKEQLRAAIDDRIGAGSWSSRSSFSDGAKFNGDDLIELTKQLLAAKNARGKALARRILLSPVFAGKLPDSCGVLLKLLDERVAEAWDYLDVILVSGTSGLHPEGSAARIDTVVARYISRMHDDPILKKTEKLAKGPDEFVQAVRKRLGVLYPPDKLKRAFRGAEARRIKLLILYASRDDKAFYDAFVRADKSGDLKPLSLCRGRESDLRYWSIKDDNLDLLKRLYAVEGWNDSSYINRGRGNVVFHLNMAPETMKFLLVKERGSLHYADYDGKTPLHVHVNRPELVDVMLEAGGGRINALDKSGKTALDYATDPKSVKMLVTDGARKAADLPKNKDK
jgi:hypothetical protein